MLQKLLLKEHYEKLQKQLEIWLEIKQLIKLLQQEKQRVKKKKTKDMKYKYHQKIDDDVFMT